MYNKGEKNRQTIITAADTLFYQRGYERTSFSDIAKSTGIPRGNFYNYFRSKDKILAAVVDSRSNNISAQLSQWDQEYEHPLARLKRFVQMLRECDNNAARYGCPVGTLNSELGKVNLEDQDKARRLLQLYEHWLAQQFSALGYSAQATELARRLLARAQGITIIAHAYRDAAFLRAESDELDNWLEGLVKSDGIE